LNFCAFSGDTALSSDTTMFGVAPLRKKFVLCSFIARSLEISRSTGVSHDIPRYEASGSG
jgi:hypothetical protein